MIRTVAALFAFAALTGPAAVRAGSGSIIVTLTPAQIEAAKEAGAARNARRATGAIDVTPQDRAIHGEMGFAIGTGGYSAIYGTAAAPLGENGSIAITLAHERGWRGYGYRR